MVQSILVARHPPCPIMSGVRSAVVHLLFYCFRSCIVAVLVDLGMPVRGCCFAAARTLVPSLDPIKAPALVHRRKPMDIIWCLGAEWTAAFLAGVMFFRLDCRVRFFPISLIVCLHHNYIVARRGFIADGSSGKHIGHIHWFAISNSLRTESRCL